LIGDEPLRQQRQANENATTQAQLPGIQAQGQLAQLQVQQARQTLQDQKIFSDALGQAQRETMEGPQPGAQPQAGAAPVAQQTGPQPGDPGYLFSRALKIAMQNGMSGPNAMAALKDNFEMRKNGLALSTDEFKEHKAELDDRNQRAGAIYEGVLNTPPEQRTQAWQQAAPQLRAMGINEDPNAPPPDENTIYSRMGMLNLINEHAGIQSKQVETAKANVETAAKQQETQQKQRTQAITDLPFVSDQDSYAKWLQQYPQMAKEMPGSYSPAIVQRMLVTQVPVKDQPTYIAERDANLNPQQWGAKVDAAITDPQLNRITKGAVQGATTLDQKNAALQAGVAKQSQLANDLNPQIQAQKIREAGAMAQARFASEGAITSNGQQIASAISNYKQAPLSAFALRTPQGQAIMAEVQPQNPDYHSEYYGTFQKTENDATTGKIGTSANALNTMMGHLDVLNNAAGALKNGDYQALNRLANFVGVQTGQSPVTTYQTIVHRLGPEVTKAYLASGGSVGERGTNEEDFDPKLSPDQIKANIGISAHLADSKIAALQDQYNRGTYGRGQQKLISDIAESARQRLSQQAPAGTRGQAAPAAGAIRVKRNSDGQIGTINPSDFDPGKYTKL